MEDKPEAFNKADGPENFEDEEVDSQGWESPLPLRFYWAMEGADSGKVYTQFDLETGEDRPYEDPEKGKYKCLVWIPFRDPELIDRIDLQQSTLPNPTPIEPSVDPIYQVVLKPGERGTMTRRGYINYFDYYRCTACNTEFMWGGVEQSPRPECPSCGTHNDWYCDICKKVIPNPIFFKSEVRCPVCEARGAPRGLIKIRRLKLVEGVERFTNYVIRVEDKFELEIGNDQVTVKSL